MSPVLRTSPVRLLDDRHLDEAIAILDAEPVSNVFVSSRVHVAGLDSGRLGAQMWGYHRGGQLTSLCYSGANLVPVAADSEASRYFADKARSQGRRCSSIVGPVATVTQMWNSLRPSWGRPRAVRAAQPVMSTTSRPPVAPDPRRTPRHDEGVRHPLPGVRRDVHRRGRRLARRPATGECSTAPESPN